MRLGEIPAAGPNNVRSTHGGAATPDYGPLDAEEIYWRRALIALEGTWPIAAGPSDFVDGKKGKVVDPRD